MIAIVGVDLKHVAVKIEIIILKQCYVNKKSFSSPLYRSLLLHSLLSQREGKYEKYCPQSPAAEETRNLQ